MTIDGVQTGVGQTLTKVVVLRQDRTPSRTDSADVRACNPRPGSPVELDERYRRVQDRCLKVFAVNHEVVRQEQLLRRRRRSLRE